jgi:hypothetical protein
MAQVDEASARQRVGKRGARPSQADGNTLVNSDPRLSRPFDEKGYIHEREHGSQPRDTDVQPVDNDSMWHNLTQRQQLGSLPAQDAAKTEGGTRDRGHRRLKQTLVAIAQRYRVQLAQTGNR